MEIITHHDQKNNLHYHIEGKITYIHFTNPQLTVEPLGNGWIIKQYTTFFLEGKHTERLNDFLGAYLKRTRKRDLADYEFIQRMK